MFIQYLPIYNNDQCSDSKSNNTNFLNETKTFPAFLYYTNIIPFTLHIKENHFPSLIKEKFVEEKLCWKMLLIFSDDM